MTDKSSFDVESGQILVTGATGLIGGALSRRLNHDPLSEQRLDIRRDQGWESLLAGKRVVIHCAALATGRGVSPAEIDEVNVNGAVRIARLAREVGVRRFVFFSSVKVFGEYTLPGERFSDAKSERRPTSRYGQSKAKAEDALMNFHHQENFEIIVLRPTVVVAKESRGAVGVMWKLAANRIPLPVPMLGNARDFVGLENLVEATMAVIGNPHSGGKAFSITDRETISTRELYQAMVEARGKRAHFLPVPGRASRIALSAVGKGDVWHRFFGNLEVDGTAVEESVGWKPKTGTLQGIAEHGGWGAKSSD